MTPDDFQKLADILKSRSGLVLSSDKAYLAESRLTPLARTWDFADAKALIRALVRREGKGGDPKLLVEVVEAMTTNESFFFRDTRPFDQLRERPDHAELLVLGERLPNIPGTRLRRALG